jgi:hypothetical protein
MQSSHKLLVFQIKIKLQYWWREKINKFIYLIDSEQNKSSGPLCVITGVKGAIGHAWARFVLLHV